MGVLYADLKASQARLSSLVSLSSDWLWEQDAECASPTSLRT